MPVLATRLRVPARRRALVPRDRLVESLAAAAASSPRLVLVSAPAGFGTTTLLIQWLTSPALVDATVVWLALDPADGDVHRFLTDLVAAIGMAAPEVGDPARAQLAAGAPAPQDVLVSLINELDLRAGTTVIALDDYHLVEGAEVHEAVTFLLDNLPPRVTLAVTTRADPPLPLARLRARAELVEIRSDELRFTAAEAESFLNEVMALGLTPPQVAALGARTEGWATGLQLAALSVPASPGSGTAPGPAAGTVGGAHGTTDPVSAFVDAFAGSHRFVLDYLVEEVLDRQPPAVRDFLLDTSVLEQVTADLGNALTGRADAAAMLDALDRGNVFLVTLDRDTGWYRYHHLFAEALRARLHAAGPARVGTLHRAAARWYAAAGLLTDAVPHALAAPDPELAGDLMELALPELRRLRHDRTMRDWLAALPDDEKRHRPLLAAAQAWARLAEGRPDEVEAWLDAAASAAVPAPPSAPVTPPSPSLAPSAPPSRSTPPPLSAPPSRSTPPLLPAPPPLSAPAEVPGLDPWRPARATEWRGLPAMIAVYRAAVAQARGDVAGTVAHAERALTLAPPDDHGARGAAAGFLGLAAWARGDLATAVTTFTDAVGHLRAAGKVTDELGATVVLAQMVLAQGRPDEAGRLYEQALAVADRPDGPALSSTGDLHVGLADVLREQNRLTAAQRRLDRAADLGPRASLPENRFRADVAAAGLRRAAGDLDGAAELLDRAASRFRPGYFPDVRPAAAARARLDLARGRLDAARAWARDHAPPADEPPRYLTEDAWLTLARVLIAEGRASDAIVLLDRLLAAAGERPGSVVEIRLVRAVARDAAGDPDAAAVDLAAALTGGMPAGYRRLFLDEGEPVLALLRRTAGSAAPPVRTLAPQLQAAAREPARRGGSASGADGAPAGEPSGPAPGGADELSPRELEVLRLLATELTGPEIARTLFVSVNTLRTHTKRIFAKLGVSTRRAAVARAADRGLLSRSGARGNHPADHIMR
ncbi:tetratricopeptide repeat protein [Nakamurella sp.]|uniref:tetratricopeptide repeat protein n=1 Tax=Nakamurella sp. TaxID=1869182 RepID=UPI003B3B89D5